jgi:cell division transport system permease protein
VKYNIIGYFLSEGFRNVFKNKKSTISCLGIMCVTMLMFGVFFAIGKNITHIVSNLEDAQAIRVNIQNDTSEEDVVKMKDQILAIDGVADAKRKTKQDAFNEMKNKLEGYTSSMEGIEPDFLFDSYIVTLTDLDMNDSVQEQISKLPHFRSITSSNQTINTLSTVGKWIRIFTGTILVVLILISIFIIANTIKLTVHARRKEISIMKYVGATNSFIRAPFMIEGVIIGIMSSAISLGIVGALYNWGTIKMAQSETIQKIGVNMLQFKDLFSSILIVYIILGVGIGIIGSRISMRKYLDV